MIRQRIDEDEEDRTSYLEKKALKIFSLTLDILTFLLIVALLIMIFKQIIGLFLETLWISDIKYKIDAVLFALILVELFTILFYYLKEHRVRVDRIIEVGIISLVRDIIFKIFDLDNGKLYAMALILLVLGVLFFIEKYYAKNLSEKEN